MRRMFLVIALSPLLWAQVDRVGVDPRVELLSILFRLAGNPEYNQGRVPTYNKAVDDHFESFHDHEAVQIARQLRQTRGISFDAVMSLAIHVTDVESLGERVPLEQPQILLDSRWRPAEARRFLEAARRFVGDTRFLEFMESQKSLFEATRARHRALVDGGDMPWFDKYFGTQASSRFEVVSGMLTGTNSYGPSVVGEDGVLEVYAIQGVFSVDDDGIPVFPPGYFSNVVHEVTHSYANPLIERNAALLDAAGRRLLEAARRQMESQYYGTPFVVLAETLVRACTLRYTAAHDGPDTTRRAVEYEHARGFVWVGELSEVLARYEASRDEHPSLDTFMPQVIAAIDDISWRAASMVASYEASRPKIEWMTFENGAVDVDASTPSFTIRFDRTMRRSATVAATNPALYPRFTKGEWDSEYREFKVFWALEPGRDYEFVLTGSSSSGFVSHDGVPMTPMTVRVRTAAAR